MEKSCHITRRGSSDSLDCPPPVRSQLLPPEPHGWRTLLVPYPEAALLCSQIPPNSLEYSPTVWLEAPEWPSPTHTRLPVSGPWIFPRHHGVSSVFSPHVGSYTLPTDTSNNCSLAKKTWQMHRLYMPAWEPPWDPKMSQLAVVPAELSLVSFSTPALSSTVTTFLLFCLLNGFSRTLLMHYHSNFLQSALSSLSHHLRLTPYFLHPHTNAAHISRVLT